MWKKWLIGDAFALPNRDLGFYRDKYLFLAGVFAVILAFAPLQAWPVSRSALLQAAMWGLVLVICLALSPRRWIVLTGIIGFLAVRGFVAFASSGKSSYVIFGLCTSVLSYATGVIANRRNLNVKLPADYTVIELGIDMAVFCLILVGMMHFQALFEKLSASLT